MEQLKTEAPRRWNPIALLAKLEKYGMNRETATTLIEAFEDSHEHQNATKQDLRETEHRLQLEIEKVRSDLELKLAETNQKITETKRDLELKLAETNQKITEIKRDLELKLAETNQKIAETKSELIKWMFKAMIAQTGIIVVILGLLIKFS